MTISNDSTNYSDHFFTICSFIGDLYEEACQLNFSFTHCISYAGLSISNSASAFSSTFFSVYQYACQFFSQLFQNQSPNTAKNSLTDRLIPLKTNHFESLKVSKSKAVQARFAQKATAKSVYQQTELKKKNLIYALTVFSKLKEYDAHLSTSSPNSAQKPNLKALKSLLNECITFIKDNPEETLDEKNLQEMLALFKSLHGLDLLNSRKETLISLAIIFNVDYETIKESLINPLLEKLSHLKILSSPITGLTTPSDNIRIYFEDNGEHLNLKKLIKTVSLQTFTDIIFASPYKEKTLEKSEEATIVAQYQQDFFNITLPLLQSHLFNLVQKIRLNEDAPILSQDIKTLSALLALFDKENESEEAIIDFLLAQFTSLKTQTVKKNIKAKLTLDEFLKSHDILSKPKALTKASSLTLLPHLTNLGCTCYMNSVLWMLARFPIYDVLLEKSLPDPSTVKEKALYFLQAHLSGLIDLMRREEPIKRDHLSTLYFLLNSCGWEGSISVMQDPQEFIMFLLNNFLSSKDDVCFKLNIVQKVQWQDEEVLKSSQIDDLSYDFPLSIPSIQKPGQSMYRLIVAPGLDSSSIDDLYKLSQKPEVIADYRPEHSVKSFQAFRSQTIVGTPPKAVLVHQKRFKYNDLGASAKINGQVPVFKNESLLQDAISPKFSLDICPDKDDLNHKIKTNYRLNGVICHEGDGINSGHYTFYSLQTLSNDIDAEAPLMPMWLKYDDKVRTGPAVFLPGEPDFKTFQSKINTDGYYLIYELDES